jgi:hypothetical protein
MDSRNALRPPSPRPFRLKRSPHSLNLINLLNLLNRMVIRHRCRNLQAEAVADFYRERCPQPPESLAVHCSFRASKV